MPQDINFLRERRKNLSVKEKKDKQLLKIAGVVYGVVLVIFVIVYGIQIYLSRQLDSVVQEEKAARSQIVENQDVERSYVIFSHKLTSLSSVYQDRLDKKEAIAYFTNIFGPSIFVKEITFDQIEKLLVFRLQSSDIFHLQDIFTVVNSPETQQKFYSVNASNLQRSPDGKYEMNVVVSTKKKV